MKHFQMHFKIYLYTYIFILMHVLDSIEVLYDCRDNGHAHELLRPENVGLLELEPEQKHDMLGGMARLRPEEDESSTDNSNSGDSDNEQINWLTQVKQYVSKLVMVSNWIPQNNVIYHVTKVVNFWNYNPRFTVINFGISNDSSNDSMNDNKGAFSQDTTNSEWVGMTNNDLLEDDSEAVKIAGKADNLGEEIGDTGVVMRRLILPANVVPIPREKRSILDLSGLLDTAGNLIGGVVGTIGTVLGTGTGKKGAGGGGTSVDESIDVRARHKRSLILI